MKTKMRRWALLALVFGGIATLVWTLLKATGHPAAAILVLDAAGKPVAGASIRADGMRTKAGPYRSGWYGWPRGQGSVTNPVVITANDGTALIPYPQFVFEKIETGVLCLSVDHPDFALERPEVEVATAPPKGAPFSVIVEYWLSRIRGGSLVAHTKPVVLKQGGILSLTVRSGSSGPRTAPLFAQVSGMVESLSNQRSQVGSDSLMTRRLPAGPFTARLVRIEPDGTTWFSEVVSNTASSGQTNAVEVSLVRGYAVHGSLDAGVPRPVRNGRVIAHIWPEGYESKTSPPQWHAWTKVRDDGGFEFTNLPSGILELVVLCDGFVSTNGPGRSSMRYPQKHRLGTEDLAVVIGMEPTARLEVLVTDDKGKPLKDATIIVSPNVRYGEWSATILASDLYNTVDLLSSPANAMDRTRRVPDFVVTTGADGRAVMPNLPAETRQFTVRHPEFSLPFVTEQYLSRKSRVVGINLTAGRTNYASVQMERNPRPIAHY